jgi:hypothetical protein
MMPISECVRTCLVKWNRRLSYRPYPHSLQSQRKRPNPQYRGIRTMFLIADVAALFAAIKPICIAGRVRMSKLITAERGVSFG